MTAPPNENAPPAGAGEAHKDETVAGLDGDYSAARPAAQLTDRPDIGEVVAVHGLAGRFVVTATDDPALVTLENERGVFLRVGERQVRRVEGGAE